jgi:hypothetical protein
MLLIKSDVKQRVCRKFLFAFFFVTVFIGRSYSQWQLYISNDVCMDYTWNLTEEQTREYAAGLIAAHLDAMNATDNEPWQNKARYTCTVTNEVIFFLEKYPLRRAELINRIIEGRIMISPFLANTNWGFPGVEGFLRSMYPAKRFAADNHLPLKYAVHSELPSLSWGIVPLLSGSGILWINKPYYNFDAAFGGLNVPPLFILIGPDSSKINVLMDKHASSQYHYMQGDGILKTLRYKRDTLTIENFWLPYYSNLSDYPLKTILAEGTHSDLSSESPAQVSNITQKIIDYNRQSERPVTLVNATFSMFAELVDSIEVSKPFLPVLKGDFGHSWEVWPLALAKYALNLRRGENSLISAEALLASANFDFNNDSRLLSIHRRAEWLMGMLYDHAWNGSDSSNIKTNGDIRKRFSEELLLLTDSLKTIGFAANGLTQLPNTVTVFNPTNYSRSSMVEIPLPKGKRNMNIWADDIQLSAQLIVRNGIESLCFLTDTLSGYGFATYKLKPGKSSVLKNNSRYSINLNKTTGIEIINSQTSEIAALLQLKYVSGNSYYANIEELKIISEGTLATIYQISGHLPGNEVVIELIIPKTDNSIDFNISVTKEINTSKEGLYLICKLPERSLLHVETTAAVVRPYLAPKGDYLPGADTSRMVMQGFANAEYSNSGGLVLTSPDAFCLNRNDSAFVIQLLGNNNNYREAIKDQNSETKFNFNFSLTPYSGKYSQVQSHTLGFLKQMPMLVAKGMIPAISSRLIISNPEIKVTSYKPADPSFGTGSVLRLWNTSPDNTNVFILTNDFRKAWLTDLLEQDIRELDLTNGEIVIPVHGNGFAGIRLLK